MKKLTIIGLLILVSGCAFLGREPVDAKIESTRDQMEQTRVSQAEQYQPVPAFVEQEGLYLGARQSAMPQEKRLPAVFKNKVRLSSSAMTLEKLAPRIAEISGLPTTLAPELRENQQGGQSGATQSGMMSGLSPYPSISYEGALSGLLDAVSAAYTVSWEYTEDGIEIFRTRTRSYELFMLGGTINNSLKVSNSSSGTGSASAQSLGSLSGTGTQTTEFNTQLTPWQSVSKNVESMLSEFGSVAINQLAGMVTVTDTPMAQRRVQEYIRAMNASVGKQVAVTLEVYMLDNRSADANGFSLDAVYQDLISRYGANVTGLNPVGELGGEGELSAMVLEPDLATAPAGSRAGEWAEWSGSQLVMNAVKQHAHVTQVTSQRGLMMNNRPTNFQDLRRTGYIARTSVNAVANAGVTQEIVPGEVVTGFSATLVPRVVQTGRVMLRYNIRLSSLISLNERKFGDVIIATPSTTDRNFIHTAVLRPGSTLVLAGYESDINRDEGNVGLSSLSNGNQRNHSAVLITITINRVAGA